MRRPTKAEFVRRAALGAAVVSILVGAGSGRAAVPPGFTETLVASGLTSPTAMTFAPDGRLFVAQQGGALRVIKNGLLLTTPFVSLSVDSNDERGLLGVAFDPSFATNHFVYVYHTVPGPPAAHNQVSSLIALGDVAVAGSEVPIFDLNDLSSATNHNGGAIHFGPDGKLYVAVGENANSSNSQTLSNLLGKMLRINSDGSIPADNPFFGTATGQNRAIWALGLRNPYTFAFQAGTGRMFLNDVGESTWEEIDDGIAGSNYGWPTCEGPCSPANPSLRDPLFWYGHGLGPTLGCAIVGSAFYNPPTVQFPPDYLGKYFFADLCNGWIRSFDPATGTASNFASGIASPVDLAVSEDGALYYLDRGTGSVYRITATSTAVQATSFRAARRGSAVVVSWHAGGDPRVLGFDLYRGKVRLNRALIPASRPCCSWLDRKAGRPPATYRLVVVFADGSRRLVARTVAKP
jgi:glucose/arabinose dehydrogenase